MERLLGHLLCLRSNRDRTPGLSYQILYQNIFPHEMLGLSCTFSKAVLNLDFIVSLCSGGEKAVLI